MTSPPDPLSKHDLVSLITTSPSNTNTKIYPSEDSIVSLLQARWRAELPYTRIGSSGSDYVYINPLKTLGCFSDEHRRRHQESVEGYEGCEMEPSVFELAGRVWRLMQEKKESQSIVYQWVHRV